MALTLTFHPDPHPHQVVGLAAAEKEGELRERLKAAGVKAPEIVTGSDGQIAAAVAPGADTVVTGVVGVAGLLPTIEAIKLGRTIALANKETLISGGPVMSGPAPSTCGPRYCVCLSLSIMGWTARPRSLGSDCCGVRPPRYTEGA